MICFQFKFATPLDTFLIVFGLLVSFSMGAAMPVLCILFGDTLQVGMESQYEHYS